jgi:hypothetical protein
MGSHFTHDSRPADGDVVLRWEFLEGSNRLFYWRAVAADGTVSHHSRHNFRSLEECVADASRIWRQAPGRDG